MLLAVVVNAVVQIRIGQVRIHVLLCHLRVVLDRIGSRPAAALRRLLRAGCTGGRRRSAHQMLRLQSALQPLHVRRLVRSQIVEQLGVVIERVHRIVEVIAIRRMAGRMRMVLDVRDDRLQVAQTPPVVQHHHHDDAAQYQHDDDAPGDTGRVRVRFVGKRLRHSGELQTVGAAEAVPAHATELRVAGELGGLAVALVHAVLAVEALRADWMGGGNWLVFALLCNDLKQLTYIL